MIPISTPVPTTLHKTVAPRGPEEASLNATATPDHLATPPDLPGNPAAGGPAPAAAAAATRLGRTGTIKKGSKRSGSKQPPRRSNTNDGYEGGVERHGQPNDFVDPDDSSDSDVCAPTPIAGNGGSTRPGLGARAGSGRGKTYGDALSTEILTSTLGPNFPDQESVKRSMLRNRNPSMSSHAHPGRLPLHSRNSSARSSSGGGGFGRPRSASITSLRSVEATSHPFPTPGHKGAHGKDEWKSVEEKRLDEDERKEKHWKRWGPYVSERQWVRLSLSAPVGFHLGHTKRLIVNIVSVNAQATVREDYSDNGDAWTHFPHEHARSRAYRWGEDGLGGISDNHGKMCFSIALWNGVDPILKERMFGTTGHQGEFFALLRQCTITTECLEN